MTQGQIDRPSFGLVNGRPLFLDVASDSYFRLPPEDEQEFMELLHARDANSPRPVEAPRPRRSVLDGKRGRVSIVDLAAVWRCVRRAKRALDRLSFADVVGRHDRPPATISGAAVDVLAQRFAAVRCWVPVDPHCLTDSIALLAFLRANGAVATIVFGAKMDPFAAHCWVQSNDLLLNDRIDRIEGFTPVGMLER